MNKREATKLRKQRLAQIDAAYAARYSPRMSERALRELNAERDRQLRLAQNEYKRGISVKSKKQTVSKRQSRFWQYFGQDGLPVAPWETEVGPHVEDAGEEEDDLWSDGEYGYEDFDTDWGGYEYSDTGYADEDA